MSEKIVSIIGTAGRKTDSNKINLDLYNSMYQELKDYVNCFDIKIAASGGAAVADHLAVRGYNEGLFEKLILFFPSKFENSQFVPNPNVEFNPGLTANKLHYAFSKKCNIDSLKEIDLAIKNGAIFSHYNGFKRRNLEVANICTHLIAFTFGNSKNKLEDINSDDSNFTNSEFSGLKDGGTAHTWSNCWRAENKRHVNLNFLNILDNRLGL